MIRIHDIKKKWSQKSWKIIPHFAMSFRSPPGHDTVSPSTFEHIFKGQTDPAHRWQLKLILSSGLKAQGGAELTATEILSCTTKGSLAGGDWILKIPLRLHLGLKICCCDYGLWARDKLSAFMFRIALRHSGVVFGRNVALIYIFMLDNSENMPHTILDIVLRCWRKP